MAPGWCRIGNGNNMDAKIPLWHRKYFRGTVKFIIIITGLLVVALVAFLAYTEWYISQIVYSDKRYLFYVKAEPAHEESYHTLYDGLRDVIPPDVYEKYVPFLKNRISARYGRVIVMQSHEETRYPRGDTTGYVLVVIYVRDTSDSSFEFDLERGGGDDDAVAYYTEGLTHYGHLVCVGYASAGNIAVQEISPERMRVQANLAFSPADGVEGRHLRCEDKKIQIDEEFEFGGRYREIQ